ncbi:sorting nexin 1-like [Iris pallida]|uniref:Sorting nexin 1-like n=1 Tax=Iris pallida TaxID=29817 RepID=A0AAX6GRV5_IRIPA|nr:sorting nexin 1-like [Iris pallida]
MSARLQNLECKLGQVLVQMFWILHKFDPTQPVATSSSFWERERERGTEVVMDTVPVSYYSAKFPPSGIELGTKHRRVPSAPSMAPSLLEEEEEVKEIALEGNQVRLVTDKETNKPRGYAFIEYMHTRDMKIAYKQADGRKLDNRRVFVDVERGRTVLNWRPRRFSLKLLRRFLQFFARKFRFNAEFIEMRRQALDIFINRVASHPELKQSEDLRFFFLLEYEETMERARTQETGIFKKKPADFMQLFKEENCLSGNHTP